MAKLWKNVCLFFLLLFLSSPLVFAEDITLTTYYPSPYGSYSSLQTDRLGVGDNNGSGTFTSDDIPTNTGEVWIKEKVAIGTTSPTNALDVGGKVGASSVPDNTIGVMSSSVTTDAMIKIGESSTDFGYAAWRGTDNYFQVGVNGTTRNLVFTPTGNVGISTTSPGALLDLGQAGTKAGTLRLAGGSSGNVTIQTAAAAGTWSLTLPTAVGSAGYQLTDAGGTGVTSWAAAASLRIWKNIIGLAQPQDALEKILKAKVYRFHYKPGKGTKDTETEYVGVLADEAPWAMHYKGTVVNPVNTLGYMILGIQALNDKIIDQNQTLQKQQVQIDALKARLDKLEKTENKP